MITVPILKLNLSIITVYLIRFFFFLFLNLFNLFYFWLPWVFAAVRRLFSGCSEQGLLFVAVHRPLIAVVSLVGEHGLRHVGFSSCGMGAQQLWLVGSRAHTQ